MLYTLPKPKINPNIGNLLYVYQRMEFFFTVYTGNKCFHTVETLPKDPYIMRIQLSGFAGYTFYECLTEY